MRHAMALFCDDVRFETGNKLSFMGVYGADLVGTGDPPVTLRGLAVIVQAFTPTTKPFERLAVTVLRDDEILAQAEAPDLPKEPAPSGRTAFKFQFVLQLGPIEFEKDCILSARVETESETLDAGRIHVKIVSRPTLK